MIDKKNKRDVEAHFLLVKDKIKKLVENYGPPGVYAGASVNGKQLWEELKCLQDLMTDKINQRCEKEVLSIAITIKLPIELLGDIDKFIADKRFKDRSDMIVKALKEWIEMWR